MWDGHSCPPLFAFDLVLGSESLRQFKVKGGGQNFKCSDLPWLGKITVRRFQQRILIPVSVAPAWMYFPLLRTVLLNAFAAVLILFGLGPS
jgi:hypothetical protein